MLFSVPFRNVVAGLSPVLLLSWTLSVCCWGLVRKKVGTGLLWGQYPSVSFFFFFWGRMCMKCDFSGHKQGEDTGLGECQIWSSKAGPQFPAQCHHSVKQQFNRAKAERGKRQEICKLQYVFWISTISLSLRVVVDVIWPKFEGLIHNYIKKKPLVSNWYDLSEQSIKMCPIAIRNHTQTWLSANIVHL